MKDQISSIPQLVDFFRSTKRWVFYMGPLFATSMFTINDHMSTFEIITCSDPFFGAGPSYIKRPANLKSHQCVSRAQCQEAIIQNQETLAYMRSKDPKPSIFVIVVTPSIVQYCRSNQINLWTISPQLFAKLGSKVEIIDVLTKADVPFIVNICSKVESYQQLMGLASKLGAQTLVVQDQDGAGGHGTFFISNQADYDANKKELQCGKVHKIMPFRKLKAFAIGGVATRSGTVLGPLQSDLIGHKQLTPYRGGYCGNQIRKSYYQDPTIDMKVRRDIFRYSQRLGDYMNKQLGYRGAFGFDFVADEDTNEVFLMEVNPRLTGSTTLAFQVYQAQGHRFPILLFHFLQFMDIKINLDIPAINQEWVGVEHYQEEVCHLWMKPMNNDNLPCAVPAGLWRFQGDVLVPTGSDEFRIALMKDDEYFFIPNTVLATGTIFIKRRCQDYRFKLFKQVEELIDKFTEIRFKDQS